MPGGGLIVEFLRWLMTHLVALCLLGFLLVGLWVFGVVDLSVLRSHATAAVEPAPVPPQDVVQKAESLPSAVTPTPQKDPEARADDGSGLQNPATANTGESGRQPKMIGGSIPLIDRNDTSSFAPTEKSDAEGGSPPAAFRPPDVAGTESDAAIPDRADLLQAARRAFWNGDYEAAEAAYMALITRYPADADAFGELGNLYQKMGREARARDAYFEAGRRLKALGDSEKLQQIIDLLVEAGDDRADGLKP